MSCGEQQLELGFLAVNNWAHSPSCAHWSILSSGIHFVDVEGVSSNQAAQDLVSDGNYIHTTRTRSGAAALMTGSITPKGPFLNEKGPNSSR